MMNDESQTSNCFTNLSPIRHILPLQWGGQVHLKPLTKSWQVPPCLHGLGVQSSTSMRSEQVRQIKCSWIFSSECVCVPSYWFRMMGRSSRLHTDTRNPDWSPCTSLRSHKGWIDRRVQLWTQAHSITCLVKPYDHYCETKISLTEERKFETTWGWV